MSAKRWIDEYESGELSLSDLLGRFVQRLDKVESENARLKRENRRLRERLAQYEPEVKDEPADGDTDSGHYGLDSLDKMKERKKRKKKLKKKRGRRPTKLKFEMAERIEKIVPADAPSDQLRLRRRRVAWRLIDGKAVLVGYEIYDAPGHRPPPIAGLPARSEFGVEISVVTAFLTYSIGISIDKACQLLQFFCQLPLRKSQADLLLSRLARDWSEAFDALCQLLAHASVVYTDETGWKIGQEGCSLWLFACEQAQVFLYGCRKNAETLDSMLPRELFTGTVVSDDAAVYSDRFVKAQKCWAHLIRKAIRLSLLYPRRARYRRLVDGLVEIFREGKRAVSDGRLGDVGRRRRKDTLENRLCELLVRYPDVTPVNASPPERDFFNLVAELRRLVAADELFTFVTEPGVEPTNNASERGLRSSAMDRKANRASKTERGAAQRSVIVSVLESLRQSLATFSLATVLAEVSEWLESGRSRFESLWLELERQPIAAPDTG